MQPLSAFFDGFFGFLCPGEYIVLDDATIRDKNGAVDLSGGGNVRPDEVLRV